MTSNAAGGATGEPALAWLERRSARDRQHEIDFDDSSLEFRRLFSEVWGDIPAGPRRRRRRGGWGGCPWVPT